MKKLLSLLLFLCTTISVSAQDKFPTIKPFMTFEQELSAKQVSKAPATTDGKTIYCGVENDLLRRAGGLATYNTNDPMNTLSLLDPAAGTTNSDISWVSESEFDCPTAGAWVDGKYYAFIGKCYSFVTARKYWGTLDMETGKFNKIADAQRTPTFDNEEMYADYSPVYSMAYDNAHKKLYALYYDVATYTGGYKNCILATVDLATGELTEVGDLQNLYYNIAIDYTGKIYALTYKLATEGDATSDIVGTYLYNLVDNGDGTVNENRLVEIKSADGDSFVGAALQDMDFDHDAWKIRWNRTSTSGTFICDLDPETGVYSNSQLIGSNAVVVGIHTPYIPADSPEAPGHVSELTATPGDNGSHNVTLSWTNPTKTWNNHEVEAVTQVNIYRGEELIGIVTEGVEKGGQSSFVDTKAIAGDNTYKVVPCRNEDEEGLPTTITAFVGSDAPGAPQNVVLSTTDGYNADISWDAPADGKNGGWYDQSTLTYTLTRQPDGVVVAKDITETTFQDQSLPTTKSYSYEVQASNAEGEGLTAVSNELVIGPAIVPPYSVTLNNESDASMWTTFDANGDGDGWRYEAHPWYAWISTSYGNAGNDWLFSPGFTLEADKSYRVRFCLHKPYHSSGGKEYITFKYGKTSAPDVASMTETLAEKVEIANYEDRYYSYTLTATETGKHYFGLNALGEASNWGTYFTAFAINEINSNDLAANAISGPTAVNATATNKYIVTVANKGAKTAENYSVQLVDDDDNVLGETAVTEPLAAQAETDVKVTWTPDKSLAHTTVPVYGRVIFDGDGDASNDNTDEPLTVQVGEVSSSSWVDYTGQEEWNQVTDNYIVPFGFSYMSTWSEVIYNREELDLPEKDYSISKISYDYTFNTAVEADIKVYIGHTDKTAFTGTSALLDKDALTLVSDSVFDIAKGSGNLVINFTSPISFSKDQNIVIAIDRRYNSYNDADIFNNHFTTLEAPRNTTLQYNSDKASFDWTGDTSTYPSNWIPVTHFLVEGTGTDGIRNITPALSKGEGIIYNVSGQRVGDNYKGIVIINGKKILK